MEIKKIKKFKKIFWRAKKIKKVEKNFRRAKKNSRENGEQQKIRGEGKLSKKNFGRLYENKLKNLMRKIFTYKKQYQVKI